MATTESFTPHPADVREIPLHLLITNPLYPPSRLADLDAFEGTITESGFIIPPNLMPVPEGYVVLDGHRRIAGCRQLGFRTLRCSIVPPYTGRACGLIHWQGAFAESTGTRCAAMDRVRRAFGLPD